MKIIALLDDDPDEYLLLADAFAVLNIPVYLVQFLTFAELTRYLAQAPNLPEMLLLDVNMPGVTGVAVLRSLKAEERYAGLQVVMHSSTCDPEIIDECFKAGAMAFMKKASNMQIRLHHLCILLTWSTHEIFTLPSANLLS
jgi:CheY-like chemotaxis protein